MLVSRFWMPPWMFLLYQCNTLSLLETLVTCHYSTSLIKQYIWNCRVSALKMQDISAALVYTQNVEHIWKCRKRLSAQQICDSMVNLWQCRIYLHCRTSLKIWINPVGAAHHWHCSTCLVNAEHFLYDHQWSMSPRVQYIWSTTQLPCKRCTSAALQGIPDTAVYHYLCGTSLWI